MNSPADRRNGSRPSEAAIAAARSLLGTAIKGDPDAARELATIPAEAWPDTLSRETARAIIELTADGTALEVPILFERLTVVKISPSDVSAIAEAGPTYQPWVLASLIRDEYIERQERRFYELRARGEIGNAELRQCLADLRMETPAERAANRKPVSTREWLESEPTPIEYLYDGMIARRALVLITGMGGLGKSGILLTLVTSGCIGRPLFPAFQPVRRLRVLWLCSEDDSDEVWRRWARLSKAYGLSEEQCKAFVENLRLYCIPGIPLMDSECALTPEYTWLKHEVETFKPDLLVLDPLAHYHLAEENANTKMAMFMSRLRDLSLPHGAAVLCVHHVPKARQLDAESAAARGASSIRDGARAMFSLVPLTKKEVNGYGISNPHLFTKLEHTKASWTPLSGRTVFFINRDGVWHEVDMTRQRAEIERAARQNLITAVVEAIGDNPGNVTEYQIWHEKSGKTIRNTVQKKVGKISQKAIRQAIQDACDTGLLFLEKVQGTGKQASIPRQLAKSPANRQDELAT